MNIIETAILITSALSIIAIYKKSPTYHSKKQLIPTFAILIALFVFVDFARRVWGNMVVIDAPITDLMYIILFSMAVYCMALYSVAFITGVIKKGNWDIKKFSEKGLIYSLFCWSGIGLIFILVTGITGWIKTDSAAGLTTALIVGEILILPCALIVGSVNGLLNEFRKQPIQS